MMILLGKKKTITNKFVFFQFRATLFYKFGLRYQPFALDLTKNVCDLVLLEPSKRGVDVNMFFGAFEKYTNLIHKCPYKVIFFYHYILFIIHLLNQTIQKGNFYIHNMPASSFNIPPFSPAGEYRVDFRLFTTTNKTVVFARVYFTIKAKGLHILPMGQN